VYEYHEKESVVRSPSKTQSCDLSRTHIDHEVENVQGTETTSITTSETELPRNLGRAGLTA
jgi:hypothetical protein